jgi:hypothetical protein
MVKYVGTLAILLNNNTRREHNCIKELVSQQPAASTEQLNHTAAGVMNPKICVKMKTTSCDKRIKSDFWVQE